MIYPYCPSHRKTFMTVKAAKTHERRTGCAVLFDERLDDGAEPQDSDIEGFVELNLAQSHEMAWAEPTERGNSIDGSGGS